ncbi:DUF4350 domain-containing protein [Mycobacterium sp. pUA109]|uniref:DUF4350 domain-containing protein n=1 Tax=Mycobacterium sp. pUA109 TaxID=3238982 RepID=UPI00351BD8E3
MGSDPVTAVATRPPTGPRGRTWWWTALALIVIVAVAALSAYLTAPRPGGPMDPTSTGSDGGHALVALLRDHGVDVVLADNIGAVEHQARPDTQLLIAETPQLTNKLLQRLADVPGDRLLVAPTGRAREALAPDIKPRSVAIVTHRPSCGLRAANQAGPVDLYSAETYTADRPVISCYDGAVVSYRDRGRTVTVVGSAYFLMNKGLLSEGNAALAMNLAGARPRLIWYAPQHVEGESSGAASILDLIPDNVSWLVWQLGLVVLLLALWKGRRLGPLVAEQLPVVVRASETVEGRGRLYRSRRARDRAAQALRTATLQRLLPRLGLAGTAPQPAVAMAVAQRSGANPAVMQHILFGPPPDSDTGLLQLAHDLDDIERQVSHS